jgi:hypothetical protein
MSDRPTESGEARPVIARGEKAVAPAAVSARDSAHPPLPTGSAARPASKDAWYDQLRVAAYFPNDSDDLEAEAEVED